MSFVFLMGEHGWTEADLAAAGLFGAVVGLVAQTPLGMLVDATARKRLLLAACLLLVGCSALAIVAFPVFWVAASASVVGALAGPTLAMGLAAASLGMVGRERFPRRAARNEALFHAGSGAVNVLVLWLAPSQGVSVAFWLLAVSTLASEAAVAMIPRGAIDPELARGLDRGPKPGAAPQDGCRARKVLAPLASRPLLVFALSGALFHMANASLFGVLVQRATRLDPDSATQVAAACMIAAQVSMVATATLAGAWVAGRGWRGIVMVAFLALVARGLLLTLADQPVLVAAIQLLDGIGVAIFGVLFPVIIADAERGGGRFGTAQGTVGTVHGLGGLTSAPISAAVILSLGYDAAFLILALIAATGLVLFWAAMPETAAGPRGACSPGEGGES